MLFVFIVSMKFALYFINKFIASIQYILHVMQYVITIIFCTLVCFVVMDVIAVLIGFNTVSSILFMDNDPIEIEEAPNYFMSLSYDFVNILSNLVVGNYKKNFFYYNYIRNIREIDIILNKHKQQKMPKSFDRCVKGGGRVRTKTISKNKYMKICFRQGKSYAGEVKTTKKKSRRR